MQGLFLFTVLCLWKDLREDMRKNICTLFRLSSDLLLPSCGRCYVWCQSVLSAPGLSRGLSRKAGLWQQIPGFVLLRRPFWKHGAVCSVALCLWRRAPGGRRPVVLAASSAPRAQRPAALRAVCFSDFQQLIVTDWGMALCVYQTVAH